MNTQELNILHAEEYIEQNAKRMTVKEVAQEIKIHPSDMYRLFALSNGLTPKKYLNERLKYLVQELLCENDVTGKTMSRELGFSSEFAFYRWVKRVYGVTYKTLLQQCRKIR